MKTLRFYLTALAFLVCVHAFAQVQINKQLQMTGTGTNAEVIGIKTVANGQDAVNDSSVQRDILKYAIATGAGSSGTPYAVNLTPGILASYTTGMVVYFKSPAACAAGPVYVNVNSLGNVAIKKYGTADLAAGDIANGQLAAIQYDGANFEMLSQLGNSPSPLYGNDAGSANTYSITPAPAVTAYTAGMVVNFKAANANTGVSTLNVNSVGAKTIKKSYNTDLAANDIQSGQALSVMYDGTNFQMLTQLGNHPLHYVGQLYGGGIVVSIWDSLGVEHGLIADSSGDLSGGATWCTPSYQSTTVPADGSIPGAESLANGKANTAAMMAQGGGAAQIASTAGGICTNYTNGGFTDWYLPSILELNDCFNAMRIVNNIIGDAKSFPINVYYFSSTERTNSNVWVDDWFFGYGNNSVDAVKSAIYSVRCVRRY